MKTKEIVVVFVHVVAMEREVKELSVARCYSTEDGFCICRGFIYFGTSFNNIVYMKAF
jgi:hypothetical protein